MAEITYEECDEDGMDIPDRWGKRPWYSIAGMGYQSALNRAFDICSHSGRRKQGFSSPHEQKNWKIICKKIDKGTIPIEWVEHNLDIVREKNTDRVRIVFAQFEAMVLNIEKQKDWEAKHRVDKGFQGDFIEEESRDFNEQ